VASEKLVVPEENILEVVAVIEAGIANVKRPVSKETRDQLKKWCREMTEYMEAVADG